MTFPDQTPNNSASDQASKVSGWNTRFATASDQVRSAPRWVGVTGAALVVAALLLDLVNVIPAAFDDAGPKGRDLLLLPGIVLLCACAVWATKQPAIAAYAGAGVLALSTVLIHLTHTVPDGGIFDSLSLSQFLAFLELIFFAVSLLDTQTALLTVTSLVAADIFAALYSYAAFKVKDDVMPSLVIGIVPIIIVVAVGLGFRKFVNRESNLG